MGMFDMTVKVADGTSRKVVKLEIASTIGGKLRMLNLQTEKLVERETERGQKLEMKP